MSGAYYKLCIFSFFLVSAAAAAAGIPHKLLTMTSDCIAVDGSNVFLFFASDSTPQQVLAGDMVQATGLKCQLAEKGSAKYAVSAILSVYGSNPISSRSLPYTFVISGKLVSANYEGGKMPCDVLLERIRHTILKNGGLEFGLDIVQENPVIAGHVVGTCDSGTKRIVYTKTR